MPPARRHKDSNVPSRAGWAKLNGLDMVLMGTMRPRQSQKAGQHGGGERQIERIGCSAVRVLPHNGDT